MVFVPPYKNNPACQNDKSQDDIGKGSLQRKGFRYESPLIALTFV